MVCEAAQKYYRMCHLNGGQEKSILDFNPYMEQKSGETRGITNVYVQLHKKYINVRKKQEKNNQINDFYAYTRTLRALLKKLATSYKTETLTIIGCFQCLLKAVIQIPRIDNIKNGSVLLNIVNAKDQFL